MNTTELGIYFLTGLTAGGLSCLAVQGGLFASLIVEQTGHTKNSIKLQHWMPLVLFLLSKLIAHTLLGFALGTLGSIIALNATVRLFFQAFAAIFMFSAAMNLLHIHPVFRVFAIRPPHLVKQWLGRASASTPVVTPILLGFLTIFIPCGVTQAMEVLAISSGSAVAGGAIMFAFTLGTIPLFTVIGVLARAMQRQWQQLFTRLAAGALILMALYSLNGVMTVLGSPLTLAGFSEKIVRSNQTESADMPDVKNGKQQVSILVQNTGYSPDRIVVKAGMPVELTLKSENTYSCALAFVFPEFSIDTMLKATDTKRFTFTPMVKGIYRFSCSMGMYTGIFEVQ